MSIQVHEETLGDLSTLTLDQLGVLAVHESGEARNHLSAALQHVIKLGEVLLEARNRPGIRWSEWIESIGIDRSRASKAMRLAFYQDALPPVATEPFKDARGTLRDPSPSHALLYIEQLPRLRPGAKGYPAEVRAEAKRLREQGLTLNAVAELLNVSPQIVNIWTNPKAAKQNAAARQARNTRMSAANRALRAQTEREERDRLARQTGGDISKAYGLVRRALSAVDAAGCHEALSPLHRAEDVLVAQMRTARSGRES
jgi:predicted transcriptional regulator